MIIILVALPGAGCGSGGGFDSRLKSITRDYGFSIARWELGAIFNEIKAVITGSQGKAEDEVAAVWEFFVAIERTKAQKSKVDAASTDGTRDDLVSLQIELGKLQQQNLFSVQGVEEILQKQLRETFAEQGIFSPLGLRIGFPPLNFKLEEPLNLLVISPRDKIESIREILLKQNMSPQTVEEIEREADKLGVSSLVVELGGFAGAYPTFVTNRAGLWFTLDAAAEEWVHQYLTFKPLGFGYLLDVTGIARNYEIATMNETVAGMVSKEIGSILYEKYYAKFEKQKDKKTPAGGFNFNQSMREIRKKVDEFLARGEIEEAEALMKDKQRYLAENGYYIRKLNQAYFAFHGAYADSEASVSPIGAELKKLRSQSTSLKDFLETAASMTSRQDLINRIK